jgi:ribosome-binding factor A
VPREFSRSRRVGEQLKRLLPELLRREVKDPRVGQVTITAVELSRDLSHARVFFTPFAGQGDAAEVLEALRHAAGFLRRELRHALRLRVMPELDFRIDESIERGARVSNLIAEALESDARHHVPEKPEE